MSILDNNVKYVWINIKTINGQQKPQYFIVAQTDKTTNSFDCSCFSGAHSSSRTSTAGYYRKFRVPSRRKNEAGNHKTL
jgi:hypothetical protein